MFFKKWLARKNRPNIENKSTDQEENIHYFGDKRIGQQRITLHIVDELTNRRKTVSAPIDYTVDNLKSNLVWCGFLPDLYNYYISYSIRELARCRWYAKISETGLRNGDTLHVIYEDAELIRRSSAENLLYAEYEVVVQWENKESEYDTYSKAGRYSSERIKCLGYYSKRSIEEKLSKNIGGSAFQEFTICESSWPEYRTDAKEEEIKYLCQLSKEKKVVLFAEWDIGYAVMYGCPTAGIFKDADTRQSCSVEIVRYE